MLRLFLALSGVALAPALADVPSPPAYPRPVANWLEAQIALARLDLSCGSIDGVEGPKSASALRAFQQRQNLDDTGELDSATRAALQLESDPFTEMTLSAQDLGKLQPLSPTWLGKSQQTELAYETALEMAAEQAHASPGLLQRLNPSIDWSGVGPGTTLRVPDPRRSTPRSAAARITILLSERVLEAFDERGRLIAHFPVSIALRVDKRPVGELHVTDIITGPSYTFDPELFPESDEARTIGHKLILPPGPNNPVGLAWIGLDRTGYGIHGTPAPERVGRSESHGCFRLTNWDALTLVDLVRPDLPVSVQP